MLTKQELKDEAEKLGLEVRENFLADLKYNVAYVVVGVVIGYFLGKIF
jgi:F0F1-type ATP synthase assembly protein I